MATSLAKTPGVISLQWALLVSPKAKGDDIYDLNGHGRLGRAYYIQMIGQRDSSNKTWEYKEQEVADFLDANCIIVQDLIGKVVNAARLAGICVSVVVNPGNDLEWTSKDWVKAALEAIEADGHVTGTSVLDWNTVHEKALWYVRSKLDTRHWGRMNTFKEGKISTWSLLDDRELIS